MTVTQEETNLAQQRDEEVTEVQEKMRQVHVTEPDDLQDVHILVDEDEDEDETFDEGMLEDPRKRFTRVYQGLHQGESIIISVQMYQ